jgi:hypothetical protein
MGASGLRGYALLLTALFVLQLPRALALGGATTRWMPATFRRHRQNRGPMRPAGAQPWRAATAPGVGGVPSLTATGSLPTQTRLHADRWVRVGASSIRVALVRNPAFHRLVTLGAGDDEVGVDAEKGRVLQLEDRPH